LGVALGDLTFIEDGNKDFVELTNSTESITSLLNPTGTLIGADACLDGTSGDRDTLGTMDSIPMDSMPIDSMMHSERSDSLFSMESMSMCSIEAFSKGDDDDDAGRIAFVMGRYLSEVDEHADVYEGGGGKPNSGDSGEGGQSARPSGIWADLMTSYTISGVQLGGAVGGIAMGGGGEHGGGGADFSEDEDDEDDEEEGGRTENVDRSGGVEATVSVDQSATVSVDQSTTASVDQSASAEATLPEDTADGDDDDDNDDDNDDDDDDGTASAGAINYGKQRSTAKVHRQ
jgi:hypothetical protein